MKGKIYRNQKKYDEAHKMFNKSFAQSIDDASVYLQIADVYILQGQYDDAQNSLDNAIKINQICPYSANNIGTIQ